MKLKLIMLASLMAFGFATSANAGAITDSDGDLVPDTFDNCTGNTSVTPDLNSNGPNDGSNQVDTDMDGYGNRCDADYDNVTVGGLQVSSIDFGTFLANFGGSGTATDHNGDGLTSSTDFSVFLAQFNGPPGPSGLSCAGTIPCSP